MILDLYNSTAWNYTFFDDYIFEKKDDSNMTFEEHMSPNHNELISFNIPLSKLLVTVYSSTNITRNVYDLASFSYSGNLRIIL